MSRLVILIALLVLAMLLRRARAEGPSQDPTQVDEIDAAWRASIATWRQRRLESIAGPDGWATLVARAWLKPGANRFGGDPGLEIVLPADHAPRLGGTIYLEGDHLRVEVADGVTVTIDDKPVKAAALADDRDGKPTVLRMGPIAMHVIKRQDRFALRAKDREHPIRKSFPGLTYYPLDPAMRVPAVLERAPSGKTIPIVNILGQVEATPTPGTLRFAIGGKRYTLDAVSEEGEDELFVIFRDETAGHGTYPSGRFLYVPRPGPDGKLIIDFNKAFSPPCAFTDFATCPIPPRQNHLARKIEAGERYRGHHAE